MRLRIRFISDYENISIPIHYNKILQGIIYQHLDKQLAQRIHAKGAKDPVSTRGLKFFTFSRLISAKKPIIDREKNTISLSFPLTWIVASPLREFIVSLYNTLNRKHTIRIESPNIPKELAIHLLDIWLEPLPLYKHAVLVETLSPITVYRTDKKDGKTYTHYYIPSDPEFNELILLNLLRKYRTLTENNLALDGKAYIKPIRVASRENILYFKDTVIKGWSGIFELSLPKELFPLAFSCGLGAKNSQGFGCINIWRGNL